MKVAIIGGGIAGLTTALALQKLGMESTVYERAATIAEVGAGIWLQPNAMFVMAWLGLDQEIIRQGCILDRVEITHSNLNPIKKLSSGAVSDRYGNQTVSIHRGKLQRLLVEACGQQVKIELGKTYTGHVVHTEGVTIQFEDGQVEADLLLGADGVKSKVREQLNLPSIYRHTNQICYRGVSDITLPVALKSKGREVWGDNRRFGFAEIQEDRVYFFCVLNKTAFPRKMDKAQLAQAYATFDPIVPQIIQQSKGLHVTELYDLKRLENWSKGPVCLLGDAAHAMTPNMGQGACQGIEDAYQLSRLLQTHPQSPEVAFKKFEQRRRKKVDFVVNNSWSFGKMAHHKWGRQLMKGMMKVTPAMVLEKQMQWLYRMDEVL